MRSREKRLSRDNRGIGLNVQLIDSTRVLEGLMHHIKWLESILSLKAQSKGTFQGILINVFYE